MIRQLEFKGFGAIGYLQKGKGTQKKEAPSRTSFLRYAGTTLSLLGCHQEGFMIPRTCAEKETQIIRSLRGEANSVQTYPNLFPWKKKKKDNCFYMYRPNGRSPTESSLIKCLTVPPGFCGYMLGYIIPTKPLAGLFVLRRKSKQFTQNHTQIFPFCITTLSCNPRSKWRAPQDKMPDPKA